MKLSGRLMPGVVLTITVFVCAFAFSLGSEVNSTRNIVAGALASLKRMHGYQSLLMEPAEVAGTVANVLDSLSASEVVRIRIHRNSKLTLDREFAVGSGEFGLFKSPVFKDYFRQFDMLGELGVEVSHSPSQRSYLFSLVASTIASLLAASAFMVRRKLKGLREESLIAKKSYEISRQVAHDIRSPLAALDAFMKKIQLLGEEDRILVRSATNRIRDIANGLLTRSAHSELETPGKTRKMHPRKSIVVEREAPSPVLLSLLTESIITEKRMQYRERLMMRIESKIDSKYYGIFSTICAAAFKRVLSNLINNAVEAQGEEGQVIVSFQSDRFNWVSVVVKDLGKGISADLLSRIGKQGETHGKVGGSGLGLFHARRCVESWGGKFSIQSVLGAGTQVAIELPVTQPPEWFVPELRIPERSVVVIVDDDQSIHQIWNQRLRESGFDSEARAIHLSSPKALREWVTSSCKEDLQVIFLVDHEFLGQPESGLDAIEGAGLNSRSILVTSHFDDEKLIERCEKGRVRLIPKSMVWQVPLTIEKAQEYFDGVLIDDDELVHFIWSSAAKSAKKKLKAFRSFDEFKGFSSNVSPLTPVYVDFALGGGLDGAAIAHQLYHSGFKYVSLTTGYESHHFKHLNFLESIRSKSPPW